MSTKRSALTADAARSDEFRPEPQFPGCRPIRITREEIADFEGRIEYWDAGKETAWKVCEPTSPYHEGPGQRLAALVSRIAAVRGSPITTLGTSDLLLRNARGERHRILQADQIVYLHPAVAELRGDAVEVGADHLPDVVLEVDYSTDVRRGKLGLYESWGFPEVWVEVPDAESRSRPRNRPSALTIHRLGPRGYRPSAASAAFPGWTAAEIHTALNEPRLSEATAAVLTRVGRALGAAGGTRPDDDPWLREQRRDASLQGVARILRLRGIDVPADVAARFARRSPDELFEAALACRDAADFIARIERLAQNG